MSDLLDAAKLHYSQVNHSHAIEDHSRVLLMLAEVGFFLGSISFDLEQETRVKAIHLLGRIAQLQKEIK